MTERRHETTVDGVTAWASEWKVMGPSFGSYIEWSDHGWTSEMRIIEVNHALPEAPVLLLGRGWELNAATARVLAAVLLEAAHIAETGDATDD